MLIDKKGMLNILGWRVNIIDFLVLLFVLCLTPMFYFSWKIITRPQVQEVQDATEFAEVTDYTITHSCPICGQAIKIKVPLGELPQRYYKHICPNCHNGIELRTTSEYKRR